MEKSKNRNWKSWNPKNLQEKAKDKYENSKRIDNYTVIAYGYQQGVLDSEHFYNTVNDYMAIHYPDCQDSLSVLDVGCGVGRFISDNAELYPNSVFYGVDFSDGMVERAVGMVCDGETFSIKMNDRGSPKIFKGKTLKNVIIEQGDARSLPFSNEKFDFVNSTNLIDRVPDAYEIIKEIRRVLKPNGSLVITSPLDFKGFSGSIEYSIEDILNICEELGLKVISSKSDLLYFEYNKPDQPWKTFLVNSQKTSLRDGVFIVDAIDLPKEALSLTYKTVFEGKPWFEEWPISKVYETIDEVFNFSSFDGNGLMLGEDVIGFAYGFNLAERDKFKPIAELISKSQSEGLYYLAEFGIHPDFQSANLGKKLMEFFSDKKQTLITRTKNERMVKLLECYFDVKVISPDFIDQEHPDRNWYFCTKK